MCNRSTLKHLLPFHIPIRTPTRRANLYYIIDMCPSSTFQPTHLLEVRHARCFYIHMSEAFQPTHPHGMRLTTLDRKVGVRGISTHASSWDATQETKDAAIFQPTHPHGMRQRWWCLSHGIVHISTHASSWDATAMIVEACKSILYRVIPRNYFFS